MGRPIGVAIVALLVLLRGIVMLIGGFQGMTASRAMLFAGAYLSSSTTGFWAWLAALIGIAVICIAYGVWNMQRWGWTWTVVLLVVSLLFDVVYFFSEGSMNWLGVAIAVIALVYLALPGTRKWFFQY